LRSKGQRSRSEYKNCISLV